MIKMSVVKRIISVLLIAVSCLLPVACGQRKEQAEKAPVSDGVYTVDFTTDGSMFHVNEMMDGKGVLTVSGGKMTVHIVMPSKNIVNLFPGSAEDAQKAGAELIAPQTEKVVYDDGAEEEVYAYDLPVPYLDREFDCAIIGTKGKWYDHKVTVSNPALRLEDGKYTCSVTLTGGSGRASVESPAQLTVSNGVMTARIVWSSPHYEYMTVDGTQYDPVNTEGNSAFEIPVTLDADIAVSALTTAMSEPHLIDYTLHFDGSTLEKAD